MIGRMEGEFTRICKALQIRPRPGEGRLPGIDAMKKPEPDLI
jgi:hypothetical protein